MREFIIEFIPPSGGKLKWRQFGDDEADAELWFWKVHVVNCEILSITEKL